MEKSYMDGAVYELRLATTLLVSRLGEVENACEKAFSIADECGTFPGGVVPGCELRILDAADDLRAEADSLLEALPEIAGRLGQIVEAAYDDGVTVVAEQKTGIRSGSGVAEHVATGLPRNIT